MIVKFTLFLFKTQSHLSLAFMSKYKLMVDAFTSLSKVQRFKELVCVYIGKLLGTSGIP